MKSQSVVVRRKPLDLNIQHARVCIGGPSLILGDRTSPALLDIPEYVDFLGRPFLPGVLVRHQMLKAARLLHWSERRVKGAMRGFYIPMELLLDGERHRFLQEIDHGWVRRVPLYRNWSTTFLMEYCPGRIDFEDLERLLRHVGARIGLGWNRPERGYGDEHGTFSIRFIYQVRAHRPRIFEVAQASSA